MTNRLPRWRPISRPSAQTDTQTEAQGQGYATEATRALVTRAFADPRVTRVQAETYPDRVPSIRVLENAGFSAVPTSSEPGVLRYEIARAATGA